MTIVEIAKEFGVLPKVISEYIQANATFRVRRNPQTGEIIIPDDVDIHTFFAPLLTKERAEQIEKEKRENEARVRKEQLAIETKIQQANRQRQETEKENSVAITSLKKMGAEGYYQYKVISLVDEDGGYVDIRQLTENLNALGIEGWHLVAAYSNELGHNSHSGGIGGFSTGTNSTVDQNILIFERFVKF